MARLGGGGAAYSTGRTRAAALRAARTRVAPKTTPAPRGAALLPSIYARAYSPNAYKAIKSAPIKMPSVRLPQVRMPDLSHMPFDPGALIRADAAAIKKAVR